MAPEAGAGPVKLLRLGWVAFAAYLGVALFLTGPSFLGQESLGPYSAVDCCDDMFKPGDPPRRPTFDDPSAAVQDYPRERLFVRGVRRGHLSEWNPFVGAGTPLWAEQGGPFFPLKLPLLLWPNLTGVYVFLTLRLVLAALGAFYLARARGRSAKVAFAAGLLFELSGAMVAQLSFVVASGLCVLPWAAFGAQKLAAGAWRAGVLASAIALAAAFHGGHPTIGLLVWLAFAVAVAMHATHRLFARRRGEAGRIVAGGALAGVLGAALAAPVLLPLRALEQEALSYKLTSSGNWSWQDARTKNVLIAPVALFAPSLYDEYREARVWLWPWPFSPALGVLALVLALAALPFAFDAALCGLGVVGAILSTGPPGFSFLPDVPLLGYILPYYCWGLVVLPLTQAAAEMVELLATRRGRIAGLVSLGVVAAAAWWFLPRLPNYLHLNIRPAKIFDARMQDPEVRNRVYFPYGLAAAALLGGWAISRTRFGRHAGLVVALVAAGEALVNDARVIGETPTRVLGAPPSTAVQFLQQGLTDGQGRFHALPVLLGRPNFLALYRIPDIRYSGPLPLRRLTDYFAAMRLPKLYFVMHFPPVTVSPLLDLAAVRFVAMPRKGTPPSGQFWLMPAYADSRITIYRNVAALPRVRVVRSIIPVPDRAAASAYLQALTLNLAHAGRDLPVALEPSEDGHAPAPVPAVLAPDAVEIDPSSYSDRLVLSAELGAPGYVLVADAYMRGWRAMVDGAEVPIHPANLLFRAVPVPAGKHRVVFEYRPPALRHGAMLFVAGVLGLGVVARRRRS